MTQNPPSLQSAYGGLNMNGSVYEYLVLSLWNCWKRSEGVALLKEVCHGEGGFEVSKEWHYS